MQNRTVWAALLVTSLALWGCGGGSDSASSTSDSAADSAKSPAAATAKTSTPPPKEAPPKEAPPKEAPTPAAADTTAAAGSVKIGVLHSLSGTMAISETSLKDVVLMAAEEINAAGGVLEDRARCGRPGQ